MQKYSDDILMKLIFKAYTLSSIKTTRKQESENIKALKN